MTKPREYSETNTYHAIMRGVGRVNVFYDKEDYEYFIMLMQRYSELTGIAIVSYCLMPNHIHLLLKREGEMQMGKFIQRLCISYTQHYFNRKYEHCGSLFQSRYVSRPLKDSADMLKVMRYIIFNPQKAGISRHEEYEYSSYKVLVEDYKNGINTTFLKSSYIRETVRDIRGLRRYLKKCSLYESEREAYPVMKKEAAKHLEEIKRELSQGHISRRRSESISEKIRYLNNLKLSFKAMARISGIPARVLMSYAG